MLYWAVGITNASVETKVFNKWTFNSDIVYSPWKSIQGNHFEFVQIIPEARFYPKGAFNGVYFGAYASFIAFDMTKWNYWNKGLHQIGRGFALGGSLGYEHKINSRLLMDVYLGAGWHNSQYRGYRTRTGEQNGSAEWLPYKVGITIGYRL